MRFSRRTRYGIAAGAVVASLAGGAIALAAGGSSAALMGRWGIPANAPASAGEPGASAASIAGATVITLIDDGQDGQGNFVDTPPHRQLNAGDYDVFEDPLKSADGSQTIGLLDVQCTFDFTKAICSGAAHLNGRGKIAFTGTSPAQNGPFLLPLTGGTSEFASARGEILVMPAGHGNSLVKVFLLP